MTMTTANGAVILTPAEVAELLLDPVEAASVATEIATVRRTESPTYRIPLVGSDPSASWVAEGDEITPSDMDFDEEVVTPSKVAGLTIITRELANDSSPEAATQVGQGLARDIARQVDAAFFGNLASPAPAGLGSLAVNATVADVQGLDVTAFDSLDVFAEAQSLAAGVGAAITSFVANPVDVLTLQQLKESTGSNRTLLGTDPTQPTRNLIGGVPLIRSSAVPAGTIWGIPQDRVYVVIREDATVETDGGKGAYFSSDRVAVKATMRVGFGFAQKAALVKITKTA
jgi:HK97 family phage major capsid protein